MAHSSDEQAISPLTGGCAAAKLAAKGKLEIHMAEQFNLDSLAAQLDLRTVGRASKPLVVEGVRELAPADILSLQVETGERPKEIKKLRQRHHALAKALASGIPDGDAAIFCGYTQSHVSILKADPSFKELLEFYSRMQENEYRELHEKIAALGEDSVDEITQRLEDNPDDFSIGQLLEVSKLALDRSGYGPQTSTNVNVNIGLADKLAAGRQRALKARAAALQSRNIIDVTPEEDDG